MVLLFVLLIYVGTFTQQQLSHLLPLGVGGSHSTVLKSTISHHYMWMWTNVLNKYSTA